jgi:antitoxin CptB
MDFNITNLKKKIIYRASYRGTKEMDVLIRSFVNEIIDNFGQEDLLKLLSFLEHNDENLYKLNKGIKTNIPIEENKITNLFKKYKLKKV